MKKLALLLILCLSAFAQTAVFPGSVVTDRQLGVAANIVQTTLSQSMSAGDTSMTVASATGIVANMFLAITPASGCGATEIVEVCNVVGTTLSLGYSACPSADGRGFDGTSAIPHLAGATVSNYIVAWNHNASTKEIEAIETSILGGGGWANANGYYLVSRATNAPANAINLGLLTSGLLRLSVSGSVATFSNAIASDVSGLWNGLCSASTYLRGDGQCETPAGAGNMSTSGSPSQYQTGVWSGSTTMTGVGPGNSGQLYVSNGASSNPGFVTSLPTAAMPTLGGDLSNSSGSLTVTVKGVNGVLLSGLASGILKNGSGGIPSIASAGVDYVAPAGLSAYAPLASPSFSGSVTLPIIGYTQCVHVNSSGVVSGTGSDCGSGGGGANANGYYLVGQASNAPTNAINLGLLSTGLLKTTVTAGVAAFSNASYTDVTTYLWNQGGTCSSSTYLRGDGQCTTPTGTGTVTTSGSPTSGKMAKFSSATAITNATAGTEYWGPAANMIYPTTAGGGEDGPILGVTANTQAMLVGVANAAGSILGGVDSFYGYASAGSGSTGSPGGKETYLNAAGTLGYTVYTIWGNPGGTWKVLDQFWTDGSTNLGVGSSHHDSANTVNIDNEGGATILKVWSGGAQGTSPFIIAGSAFKVNFDGSVTSSAIAGTGTATFVAGPAAGTSPGTPSCATSHICDSVSGTISMTTGSSPPSTGIAITINTGVTRTNLPTCYVYANIAAAQYNGVNLYPTYSATSVYMNIQNTGLSAGTAYLFRYMCMGN